MRYDDVSAKDVTFSARDVWCASCDDETKSFPLEVMPTSVIVGTPVPSSAGINSTMDTVRQYADSDCPDGDTVD